MDDGQALEAFAALSQHTRLEVFRLLVAHEPDGLAAGEIARQLEVPHNTLSSHLAVLARSGLVVAERQSRSIIYRAELEQVRTLAGFLIKDCCGGRPEICTSLVAELAPCCVPQKAPAKRRAHG